MCWAVLPGSLCGITSWSTNTPTWRGRRSGCGMPKGYGRGVMALYATECVSWRTGVPGWHQGDARGVRGARTRAQRRSGGPGACLPVADLPDVLPRPPRMPGDPRRAASVGEGFADGGEQAFMGAVVPAAGLLDALV